MEKYGIYKCSVCGNVVSAVEPHDPVPVCCGKEMILQEAKGLEKEGKEKHVPIIEVKENIVTVKVGSVPHPMEESHFIELIQLFQDGRLIKEKRLYPGEAPVAVFCVDNTDNLSAREYCNLHGLWKS